MCPGGANRYPLGKRTLEVCTELLYFVSKELALSYLLFSFLSSLGVLQWVAVRYHLIGLALLDYSEQRTKGYGLAGLLVVGSTVWFFSSCWSEIFAPGPAGAELSLLFGLGSLAALGITLIAVSLLQHFRSSITLPDRNDTGQVVTAGRTTGYLYTPSNLSSSVPAVCMIPGLGADADSMDRLARRMAQEGLVTLLIDLTEESHTYPDILAILPACLSWLSKRPEVDPQRLGALGYDLGGDLVIRAASADKQIKAIAALAPVLVDASPSLDLLREMPYLQALRWSRDRQRAQLRAELNALEYGKKIAPRPLLLLYGAEDRLVNKSLAEDWREQCQEAITFRLIQDARHLDLLDHPRTLYIVVQWFKEHL